MSETGRYYWLKLYEGFFRDKKIKKLRRIAGGDTYTIIYLKLQLLSLQAGGMLYFEGIEENLAEELALDLDEEVENVKLTLSYMFANGLIEEVEADSYLLPQTVASIGSEGSSAERVRRYRAKKKNVTNLLQSNAETLRCNAPVTNGNVEIDIEKETEIEKEIDTDIEKDNICSRINYSGIINAYNESCLSLPKVKTLSDSRKRAIKSMVKKYGVEQIKEAFKMVEQSDFLTGKKDGSTWNANFDWIMKDSNMAKILDGNYEQQEKKPDNPWMHDERLKDLFK